MMRLHDDETAALWRGRIGRQCGEFFGEQFLVVGVLYAQFCGVVEDDWPVVVKVFAAAAGGDEAVVVFRQGVWQAL